MKKPTTKSPEKVIIIHKPPQNQDTTQTQSDTAAVASAPAAMPAPKSVSNRPVTKEEEPSKEIK